MGRPSDGPVGLELSRGGRAEVGALAYIEDRDQFRLRRGPSANTIDTVCEEARRHTRSIPFRTRPAGPTVNSQGREPLESMSAQEHPAL